MGNATAHHETGEESKPTLYVVATPIGNLRDVSLRALDVLKSVDAVAAEDTRITARLLNHYGIANRMIALHEHNEKRMAPQLLEHLAAGRSVALVSDAGTPAISDPGALVVAAAISQGYRVVPVIGRVEPDSPLHINRDEVEDAFEVPLEFLMTEANHRRGRRVLNGRERHFYEMPFGERYIWGITAGIIRGLYERIYG